jgi:hypothetical protein
MRFDLVEAPDASPNIVGHIPLKIPQQLRKMIEEARPYGRSR